MKNDLLKLKKYLDQNNKPQKSQDLDFLIRIAQDLEYGYSLRKNAYSATELLGGAAGGLAGGSFGGNLLESLVSGAGGSPTNAYVAKMVGELGGGALGAWLGSKYAPKAYSHLFESTTATGFEGKIKELARDGKEYNTNSWDDPTVGGLSVSGVSNLDRDNYYIKVTLGQTPSVFNLVKDDFTLGNTFVFGPNSNPDYVVDKAKAIQLVEAGKQDLPANQKFVAEKFLEELSGAAPVTTPAPITTPVKPERPEPVRTTPVRPTIERPIAVAPSARPPTPVSPVAPGSRAGRREQRRAIRDFVRSRR